MINKKISILAGVFLSLVAGTGMAVEKNDAKIENTFISPFNCKQVIPHGEYIGKFEKIIHRNEWNDNPAYVFVNLDRSIEGCIGVAYVDKMGTQIAYDAFIQGKTVTVRVGNDGGKNSYLTAITY
ncbi:hypothetical protein [Xenorhabdus bovienii]|uniref:hypothetical protein n=1 Tax=Xenorhabdus bovienii TaxID=40576 RepID=UPI00237C6788|nr:hypothetical protein [Xenorhabdus bovienii]MDE1476185.1 hypothetical protein [Xenorhabdus bovienii]MDE1484697.1 hypothetical protein [Xenorhabdus bovienii]MDE9434292.1 hypothetical protein [Xenorhabdus bovienii]MDE9443865.1 hypothetical protein [Xenorhabdus bovienii]MDE9456248.1 hypothetical protein [Xenorhabdus bovienii]